MQDLYDYLKEHLAGMKKLAILGAGSVLMGDDAAGIAVAEKLEDRLAHRKKFSDIRVFIGNTAPENFSGEIKRFNPSHLIIIDAADMREKPGSVLAIEPEVIGGVSFSTHMLPLKIMAEYLKKETGCEIIFLGIQPKYITYGSKMTPEVKKAVDDITDIIKKIIG